jgi:hypothetical protein
MHSHEDAICKLSAFQSVIVTQSLQGAKRRFARSTGVPASVP